MSDQQLPGIERAGTGQTAPAGRTDSVGTRVFTIDQARTLTDLFGRLITPPLCPLSERCMGKRCHRRAEAEIRAIDTSLGTHQYPVRVCLTCLAEWHRVDIFRWLSDNRIESDR